MSKDTFQFKNPSKYLFTFHLNTFKEIIVCFCLFLFVFVCLSSTSWKANKVNLNLYSGRNNRSSPEKQRRRKQNWSRSSQMFSHSCNRFSFFDRLKKRFHRSSSHTRQNKTHFWGFTQTQETTSRILLQSTLPLPSSPEGDRAVKSDEDDLMLRLQEPAELQVRVCRGRRSAELLNTRTKTCHPEERTSVCSVCVCVCDTLACRRKHTCELQKTEGETERDSGQTGVMWSADTTEGRTAESLLSDSAK